MPSIVSNEASSRRWVAHGRRLELGIDIGRTSISYARSVSTRSINSFLQRVGGRAGHAVGGHVERPVVSRFVRAYELVGMHRLASMPCTAASSIELKIPQNQLDVGPRKQNCR